MEGWAGFVGGFAAGTQHRRRMLGSKANPTSRSAGLLNCCPASGVPARAGRCRIRPMREASRAPAERRDRRPGCVIRAAVGGLGGAPSQSRGSRVGSQVAPLLRLFDRSSSVRAGVRCCASRISSSSGAPTPSDRRSTSRLPRCAIASARPRPPPPAAPAGVLLALPPVLAHPDNLADPLAHRDRQPHRARPGAPAPARNPASSDDRRRHLLRRRHPGLSGGRSRPARPACPMPIASRPGPDRPARLLQSAILRRHLHGT